jgi:hypothetical protein
MEKFPHSDPPKKSEFNSCRDWLKHFLHHEVRPQLAPALKSESGGILLVGTGGNQEIIVDPQTYQFWGYQFLGSGRDIHAEGAWGMTIVRQALVPGPGVRPQGNAGPTKPA